MKIEFDKLVYNKDAIYSSLEIWSEYFTSSTINETKKHIIVSVTNTENVDELCAEFTNYVLDMSASLELV